MYEMSAASVDWVARRRTTVKEKLWTEATWRLDLDPFNAGFYLDFIVEEPNRGVERCFRSIGMRFAGVRLTQPDFVPPCRRAPDRSPEAESVGASQRGSYPGGEGMHDAAAVARGGDWIEAFSSQKGFHTSEQGIYGVSGDERAGRQAEHEVSPDRKA